MTPPATDASDWYPDAAVKPAVSDWTSKSANDRSPLCVVVAVPLASCVPYPVAVAVTSAPATLANS